ncbi:hypothetical protein ABT392_06965 [Paucibacter sp. JuS9]|uniref:hypothetical protein n=1 Tax=Paucibacter sp. JuS9 TaxID=3228748 RepID=UPI003756604F
MRELAATANTVVVEESRIKARAIGLRQEYRSLAILSGGSGGSRQQLFLDAIDEKERQAVERADDARKFIDGARSLRESTAEDIDRVQHRLANSLEVVRAMREDLDREMLAVEGQSAERRAAMEGTRLAR